MRGALRLDQFRGILDDARGFGFKRLEAIGEIGDFARAFGQADPIDPQPAIAVAHPPQNPAEQIHVASEPVGGGGDARAAFVQHPLEIALDPLPQQQLIGGQINLPRIEAVVGHVLGDFVGYRDNLGQRTFQQRHEIADRHDRLTSGQQRIKVGLDRLPAVVQFGQLRPNHLRRGR
ncbi:MAG: hypothetical protein IPP10_01415 [Candidatus Competibacteraceae bacterium]|nr:hypothetical protein [Candidatus Competibacteraceae bacterium]